MKAFIKFAFIALGFVLILIGVAALLLLTQAEGYFRVSSEERLSSVLKVPVQIERLSFAPIRQSVVVYGLTVENPTGFRGGTAIAAKRITISFDPTSFFSKQPVVERIQIDGLDVYYRYELGEGTNIAALLNAASEDVATPESGKVVYKELLCEEARFHFTTNLTPGAGVGVRVVRIQETDLDGGLPVTNRQITRLVLKNILKQTVRLKDEPPSPSETIAPEAEPL